MTTPDLAALLAWRNARFRAWAACRVPVLAEWRMHLGTPALHMACGDCKRTRVTPRLASTRYGQYTVEQLAKAERAEMRALQGYGCEHLGALLHFTYDGPEPTEVREIWALELLAGEGPK